MSWSEHIIRAAPGVAPEPGDPAGQRARDAATAPDGEGPPRARQVLRGRPIRPVVADGRLGRPQPSEAPTPATHTRSQPGPALDPASGTASDAPDEPSPGPVASLDPEGVARIRAAAEARGYADGHARAAAELEAQLAAVAELAAQLEASAPHEAAVVARAVIELALAVAHHVLDRQVSADPTLLVGLIERTLQGVNGSPEARVYLHPDAVEPVREAWEATYGSAYLGKRWVFAADPRLPRGGCSIRHEHGVVEAGLEVALDEIRLALERTVPAVARAGTPRDAEDAA